MNASAPSPSRVSPSPKASAENVRRTNANGTAASPLIDWNQDGVIDFDKATQDPVNPTHFNADYDSGDHLHPKDPGYKAMAGSIDLTLFAK